MRKRNMTTELIQQEYIFCIIDVSEEKHIYIKHFNIDS